MVTDFVMAYSGFLMRNLLLARYSGLYSGRKIELFCDLFLFFIVAELIDMAMRNFLANFIEPVKREESEFYDMYEKLDEAMPNFIFKKRALYKKEKSTRDLAGVGAVELDVLR